MAKEISFKEILESGHYQQQKEIVFNSINKTQQVEKTKNAVYAPSSTLPYVDRTMSTDYSVFKKTEDEKLAISSHKANTGKTKHHKFKTLTKVAM